MYCTAQLGSGHLVSGTAAGTLCVWDVASLAPVLEVVGHEGAVRCMVSLADGRSHSKSPLNTASSACRGVATPYSRLQSYLNPILTHPLFLRP